MTPKSGSKLPNARRTPSEAEYVEKISNALRQEFRGTRAAVKTITRWTGVSDRCARSWINGSSAPSGYHLLRLARECNIVFEAMLDLTNHPEAKLGVDLHAVEVAIAKATGTFETLRRQR